MQEIISQEEYHLTDEDIKILIHNESIGELLQPIKEAINKSPKKYGKYAKQLGRMDKKSDLVKRNLPNIVYKLYKKNDIVYRSYLKNSVRKQKDLFISMVEEIYGKNVGIEDFKKFGIDEYRRILEAAFNEKNKNVDLNLLCIQMRMNGIELSEQLLKEFKDIWEQQKIIQEVKDQLAISMEQELHMREQQLALDANRRIESIRGELVEITREKDRLRNENVQNQKRIEELLKQLQESEEFTSQLDDELYHKQKELQQLKEELSFSKNIIDKTAMELKKSRETVFNEVSDLWKLGNSKSVQEKERLEEKIECYKETIRNYQDQIKEYKEQIGEWDSYIKNYLNQIDQKVIENKLHSMLFDSYSLKSDKLIEKQEESTKVKVVGCQENNLFIIKGYTPDKVTVCNTYEDYLKVAEENLSNAGEKMKDNLTMDVFNSAIDSNMSPVICGYNSRRIALALTAARFGENSEIISIPLGFNNSQLLISAITDACTKTVIIEDAFGTMNEKILLPILRTDMNKKLIFTAESVECLQYTPRYFYNYLQLIVITRQVSEVCTDDIYAEADSLFTRNMDDGKEESHKLARYLLGEIEFDSAYVMQRGKILTELLEEDKCNSEEEAINKYLKAEGKWIFNEKERSGVQSIIFNNQKRFSNKLASCMDR